MSSSANKRRISIEKYLPCDCDEYVQNRDNDERVMQKYTKCMPNTYIREFIDQRIFPRRRV